MSAPMRRLARRSGALSQMALLCCVQLAPIGALWLAEESCCGCTSSLCCRSPRPAPPPASKACHDEAGSKDRAVLKCALPTTELALPFAVRGILPLVASLGVPGRAEATRRPAVRPPRVGSLRIDLPPPRPQLLVS